MHALAADTNSGHLQWSVTFASGTLQAKATKNGAVVVTDTVQTASPAAGVTLKVDRAAIAADGLDLAYVEADVVDAKGVLAPRASNEIAFSVTGPGALVGGLNLGDDDRRSDGAHKGVLEHVVRRVDHHLVCHLTSPFGPSSGPGRN